MGELTVRASLWVESPIDDPTDAAQVAQIEADRKAAANLVAQQMGVSGDNAFLAPLLGLDDSSGATTVALLVDEEGVVAAAASGPQPEDCPSIASDNQAVYDEGYAEGEDRRGAVLVEHHRCGDGRRSGGRRRHARVDHRGRRD